jgi:diacylglycerol kinase (ATP)
MLVAPHADLEDGRLDVVVVHVGSLMELSGVAARLVSGGDYLQSDIVTHRRCRRAEVRSRPGMWFNVDGELIGSEPVTFSLVPNALRVIVGPDYRRGPVKHQ